MTRVRCDETRHESYNVPVGRCSLNTSQDEHKFLDMHSNALTCIGESNKIKDDIIHEFWMPCEYFMEGPSGTRSFFLLYLPRHVNALEYISK